MTIVDAKHLAQLHMELARTADANEREAERLLREGRHLYAAAQFALAAAQRELIDDIDEAARLDVRAREATKEWEAAVTADATEEGPSP